MTQGDLFERRKLLVYLIVPLLGLIFLIRLFYLQVIDDRYKLSAESNVLRAITQYPDRGYIYDRNGTLIVSNQPAYDLMVIPREVKDLDTAAFCTDLGIDSLQFAKQWETLRRRRGYSYYKPSVFLKQISREQFAGVQEKLFNYSGFYVQKRTLRQYPFASAANVLGFVREVSDHTLQEKPEYAPGDYIGGAGVEKSYEDALRGQRGVSYRMVDVHNRIKGSFQKGKYDTVPVPGAEVTTTIDIDLQRFAEALMTEKRGSIVAVEPSSGEILALVSAPTYDPNLLVGRIRSANFRKLDADTLNLPMYDRAVLAEYPPGSPFKIVNALIGLQEGVLTESTTHYCRHGWRYKSLHVGCHSDPGPYRLDKAIVASCNAYFCETYKDIIEKYPSTAEGMDAWSEHVKSFGLGRYMGNDLPTGRKGHVPDAAYYNGVYPPGSWRAVTTISNAIGQGELLVTPIQLANLSATIANRGYYYTPHIVKAIDGQAISDTNFTQPKYTTIEPRYFEPIVEGMHGVYTDVDGTAYWSQIEGIEICGKTGTAENPHGQDHSIFIAFAPKDNPKIAISIFVENGYWGSRWAAPMASLLVEKYMRDSISRTDLEQRMLEGSLAEEYEQQAQRIGEER
ncbi:penicillin-binding protein 2 [Cryomorphaceae bacterium]|nr:penicillin-binding protein 2 [Cryomorphaceae bacterium]